MQRDGEAARYSKYNLGAVRQHSMELLGDMGRYGVIWGDMGRYREI
jgi:hypothetical protein